MGQVGKSGCSAFFTIAIILASFESFVTADERCKDENYCTGYCLSTNHDTVRAWCDTDLQSCICYMPDKPPMKVRFIEQRNPVPPTTPRPTIQPHVSEASVQYVNSQPVSMNGNANSQAAPLNGNGNSMYNYNYNGNGNSIAQQQQQQPQQQKPNQLVPVLLECDASEQSTRMCHMFCTMEIKAWYGLCNITSRACACFGVPLSAVQQEPITAIFHSTAPAPVTPPPTTTQRPSQIPYQGYQQYPYQQYPQSSLPPQKLQQQENSWRPIPSSSPHSSQYLQQGNQYFPNSPPVALQNNQLPEQGPVRSVASLFGPNGQPLSQGIATPYHHLFEGGENLGIKTSSSVPTSVASSGNDTKATETNDNVGSPPTDEGKVKQEVSSPTAHSRKRRSINDTPLKKNSKELPPITKASTGQCSKYKCAIACKRNNYLAPDCEPKCVDGECWCECFPRL